jgi:hypothetical protein
MAYYAKLTEQNEVLATIVYDDENETTAVTKLAEIFNWPLWKKSNGKLGKGFIYSTEHNIFIEPKPYDSWVLNTSTGRYEPPVAKPEGVMCIWNESTTSWEINN